METRKTGFSTIGELSRRSGVPVKTIRHYSDTGVLPPSGVTEAGYRLYSEADRSRLELVRTLRAAGFGLADVGRLLGREVSPEEAVRLQLEAVEMQLRTLARQRALLEAALDGENEEAAMSYPDRARALAMLSAQEREAFLEERFERMLEGVPVTPDVRAQFRRMMVEGLPEKLTDEQLEAWIELSALASDDGFIGIVREQTRPFHDAAQEGPDPAVVRATNEALREAAAALREDRPPTGECEQEVIGAWVEANARALGREGDPDFPAWLLSHHERTSDPRMDRYWRLIATLKGWDYDPAIARAHGWLLEGLRWKVENVEGEV